MLPNRTRKLLCYGTDIENSFGDTYDGFFLVRKAITLAENYAVCFNN
jgi:hypothetical protein